MTAVLAREDGMRFFKRPRPRVDQPNHAPANRTGGPGTRAIAHRLEVKRWRIERLPIGVSHDEARGSAIWVAGQQQGETLAR